MCQSAVYPPIVFLLFLALASASFGYVVGRNDRKDYFNQQNQIQQGQQNTRLDAEDGNR